jgi:hypothetical protein
VNECWQNNRRKRRRELEKALYITHSREREREREKERERERAPSITTCATCIPFGPSSRAIDCAKLRKPLLATEKAEKPDEPLTLFEIERFEKRREEERMRR